jgi:hypothetical protein
MGCDRWEKIGSKPSDPKPEIVTRSGATFYPSVSRDGVLSWTNDKDLPNPRSVKLKGKDGVDGKDGKDGFSPTVSVEQIEGGNRVNITDKDSTQSFDVMNGVGGGGGVTSWNDLTDKPFGEESREPIVWDGNTEGHYIVDIIDGAKYVQLSETPVSFEDLKGCFITAKMKGTDETQTAPVEGMCQNIGDVNYAVNGAIISVLKDNSEILFNTKPFNIPKKGIYTLIGVELQPFDVTGITFPQTIKCLDEKYLPESVVLESELSDVIGDALTQAKESGEFNGKDGTDGKDGYTPVKGVDYFTEEEVQDVVDRVLDEVPESGGGGVTSWNDLTDKPFGEESREPIVFGGNTEGLETDPLIGQMYKISETGVRKDELIGATMRGYSPGTGREISGILSDTSILDASELNPSIPLYTMYMDAAGGYFLSTAADFIYDGVTIKQGFYVSKYFISLTFPEKVKPLDEKYLPESVVLESELNNVIGDALTQAKESGEFNGKDGKDGADGYTPVKGTDYFTPTDISDIVNEVITALPKYNGEVEDV